MVSSYSPGHCYLYMVANAMDVKGNCWAAGWKGWASGGETGHTSGQVAIWRVTALVDLDCLRLGLGVSKEPGSAVLKKNQDTIWRQGIVG